MSATTFDTLKLSRRLEAAGFSREQSAGMAEALNDALGDSLVTRDYLDTRLAKTEADLKVGMADVKADILKWLFAALVGQTAVIAALVKLL